MLGIASLGKRNLAMLYKAADRLDLSPTACPLRTNRKNRFNLFNRFNRYRMKGGFGLVSASIPET